MDIAYRAMTAEDHAAVVELWSSDPELGYSESDAFSHYCAYLDRNPGCSFVAIAGERIVGTVLAGDDARRGFINHLYVVPEYRGQGIGNHLADLAEEALAQNSPTKSYVFIKYGNEQSIRFWRKRGYYLCDDFCVMRRSLSSEKYQVYSELKQEDVVPYLVDKGLISDGLHATSVEFGDGNLNHIYRVSWDGGSLILKQSMPHGKIDVSCFEPVSRGVYESRYVKFYERFIPNEIEHCLHSDETMALSVYDDYSDMTTLRKALMRQEPVGDVGTFLGQYLAHELCCSSAIALGIDRKKALESSFSNVRSRELTEAYILQDPFMDSPDNSLDEESREIVRKIWMNNEVVSRARLLTQEFVSNKQCLIHGDYHPGNIFIDADPDHPRCIVSDFDFASWGPLSYDLGTIVGNLVLSYRTQAYFGEKAELEEARIIKVLRDLFAGFQTELLKKMADFAPSAVQSYADDIVEQSFGFAACTLAGRSYGYCTFPEIAYVRSKQAYLQALPQLVCDIEQLMLDVRSERDLLMMLSR